MRAYRGEFSKIDTRGILSVFLVSILTQKFKRPRFSIEISFLTSQIKRIVKLTQKYNFGYIFSVLDTFFSVTSEAFWQNCIIIYCEYKKHTYIFNRNQVIIAEFEKNYGFAICKKNLKNF